MIITDALVLNKPYWAVYSGDHAVIIFQWLASIMVLGQALIPETGVATGIAHLGLTGCLIITVGVLWRALCKAQDQLQIINKQVSDAIAINTDAQRETRKAQEHLAAVIEATFMRLPH